ncbi:secondary thiamine-phosphate synthase enzyme YjbQ [Natrialbaceae archaeon AArc-T1-2]|uniref:secondary thiamine-phosphate synthase enzyme YjbQ n=1 Tax=Natrialbaceae archaeon AArc-T1-2 TaxID=3053904 RepID=UPI00255AC0D9|nr:secondary thiamine-phosphate synthase enzyme YjbQ [Natrialbaceae archaeon AArc-T1-2]WIV66231.1 secondary thiamine-phosphate synthase enzyme YjbQ [Natrialbaceae archaeon AArc-T1-2]
MTATFTVDTDARLTTVDVTDTVADAVPDDHADGVCTAFVEHTTAGLVVQENESRLRADLESFLSGLVPDEGHAHDRIDDNADSHLRATLLGPSVTVPVVDGGLALGTWQSILLVECDGPRTRRVRVTAV